MDLVQACLKTDGRLAVNTLRKMISNAKPSAIWAILMHAASWQEERSYDTAHSTIMLYAVHRMIEDLGTNPDLLEEHSRPLMELRVPRDLKTLLQSALIERLAYHLADVDHWQPENGPKYNTERSIESMGNAVQNLALSVRKRSLVGAHKSAITLASKGEPVRLRRAVATMAAEKPDSLGHGFIMPLSLLIELPDAVFTRPHIASLWHLAEYLVRKVPSKKVFSLDSKITKYAQRTDVSSHKSIFINSVVSYGTLGHNAIFAHRIAEAGRIGFVERKVIDWLLEKLTSNIGPLSKPDTMDVPALIESESGTDWKKQPNQLRLPSSAPLREWLADNTDVWAMMMDRKAKTFEEYLTGSKKLNWNVIRATQYAMATINGQYQDAHSMIFTQSVWGLVDHGLISEDLAALQVSRRLRNSLKM
ncbi:MAG: hypothetical protein ACP6KW_01975 [Candidatus Thorarchaeota archaeon]